jgi:hypothetical protein
MKMLLPRMLALGAAMSLSVLLFDGLAVDSSRTRIAPAGTLVYAGPAHDGPVWVPVADNPDANLSVGADSPSWNDHDASVASAAGTITITAESSRFSQRRVAFLNAAEASHGT